MIIQFSVENFRSIMELATLSLVASPLKDVRVATEDVMFDIDGMDVSLLKSAVILGANASGKSNVIKALEFFKNYIIDSFKNLQAGEEIDVESFKLNTDSAKLPSSFEMIFILDGYQYRYGMDVSREYVHGEWLYRKACRKRAKEVELFYREKEEMKVHPSFSIATDLVNRKMIRNNALLLSAAAQFNDPTAVQIINWLTETSILTCSDEERMWNMAVNHLDDVEMRSRIVEFSKFADLGIEDIEKSDNHILSRHLQYDANGVAKSETSFPFLSMESEGTIKYFSMAYPIIKALDNGSRLVIDEFDSKLHPVLTNRIISSSAVLATETGNDSHRPGQIKRVHSDGFGGYEGDYNGEPYEGQWWNSALEEWVEDPFNGAKKIDGGLTYEYRDGEWVLVGNQADPTNVPLGTTPWLLMILLTCVYALGKNYVSYSKYEKIS